MSKDIDAVECQGRGVLFGRRVPAGNACLWDLWAYCARESGAEAHALQTLREVWCDWAMERGVWGNAWIW